MGRVAVRLVEGVPQGAVTSEQASTTAPGQRVALQVQSPLHDELRAALTRQGFEVLEGQDLLQVASERKAPLIVCEVGEESEALANQLLLDARDTALVFIGPTGSDTAAVRFNVRELSVDVSVSEVVRVCQTLAHPRASDAVGAPPMSQPSRPFDVLPRVSDAPNSKHSLPAPLLPRSAAPSSRPSPHSALPVPSIPPSLRGALAEDIHMRATPEVSPELARLLSEAEERVARSLVPRQTSIELPTDGTSVELDAEVMAALEDPIGDYVSVDTSGPSDPRDADPKSRPTTPPRAASSGRSSATTVGPSSATEGGGPISPAPVTARPGAHPPLYSGAPTFAEEPAADAEEERVHSVPAWLPATPAMRQPASIPGDALAAYRPSAPDLPTPKPPASRRSQQPLEAPAANDARQQRARSTDLDVSPAPDAMPVRAAREHESARLVAPPPSEPTTSPPPSRMSDERVTARPMRGTSPLPPAPAIPRGSWLNQAMDADHLGLEEHLLDTTSGGLGSPVRDSHPSSAREAPTASPPKLRSTDATFPSEIPPLRQGDSIKILAAAIRTRVSGALVFETEGVVRRIVLRDGDFVTAASGSRQESLLSFLVTRGTLPASVETQLGHKIPNLGRHAGAALVAGGHVPQDQLWPILRAHAEYVIGRVLLLEHGAAGYEQEVPARLRAEPAVFGGATGSEVFIELLRRVLEPEEALTRLGGRHAELRRGKNFDLLSECALSSVERDAVELTQNATVDELMFDSADPDVVCVLYALTELQVLASGIRARAPQPEAEAPRRDALDDDALRQAVTTRRNLIDEGDYFAILGVPRSATGYDIRRAYLELRRQFEPSVVLTPRTLDLRQDLELVIDVVTEAYEILGDQVRRERYRRAIESMPG